MQTATFIPRTGASLIKESAAAYIREEIISGRLEPGMPVVEGKWASKLNVAQSSVRAALNIL
ncbi:MAG: GntR family transcriptional regulator, partial [Bryobacteraceae bacterium]